MSFGIWLGSTVSSASLVMFVGWLLRNLILTRLKASVQHEFDKKLEFAKSERRTAEDAFRADLRAKEAQIEALRGSALSAMAARQAAVDKRRLEAIDQLWAAFNALAPARTAAMWLMVVNYGAVLKTAATDPRMRQLFEMVGKIDHTKLYIADAWRAQSFVSEMAWALFSAYRAIVATAAIRLQQVQLGIDMDVVDMGKAVDLARTALPHMATHIAQHGDRALPHLLEELESSLLREFRRMLSGAESDASSVANAAAILREADLLTEQTIGLAASGANA